MAHRPGEQLFRFKLEEASPAILCPHGHMIGAGHNGLTAGQAQAALPSALCAGRFNNFRVHQLYQSVAHINDHHTAKDAYLGCSQAHAVCLVHGVSHVLQQRPQPQVKLFLLLAILAEGIVPQGHNFTDCHGFLFLFSGMHYIMLVGLYSKYASAPGCSRRVSSVTAATKASVSWCTSSFMRI